MFPLVEFEHYTQDITIQDLFYANHTHPNLS